MQNQLEEKGEVDRRRIGANSAIGNISKKKEKTWDEAKKLTMNKKIANIKNILLVQKGRSISFFIFNHETICIFY